MLKYGTVYISKHCIYHNLKQSLNRLNILSCLQHEISNKQKTFSQIFLLNLQEVYQVTISISKGKIECQI